MGKVKALWELEQENAYLRRVIKTMEEGYTQKEVEQIVADEMEEEANNNGQFGVGA